MKNMKNHIYSNAFIMIFFLISGFIMNKNLININKTLDTETKGKISNLTNYTNSNSSNIKTILPQIVANITIEDEIFNSLNHLNSDIFKHKNISYSTPIYKNISNSSNFNENKTLIANDTINNDTLLKLKNESLTISKKMKNDRYLKQNFTNLDTNEELPFLLDPVITSHVTTVISKKINNNHNQTLNNSYINKEDTLSKELYNNKTLQINLNSYIIFKSSKDILEEQLLLKKKSLILDLEKEKLKLSSSIKETISLKSMLFRLNDLVNKFGLKNKSNQRKKLSSKEKTLIQYELNKMLDKQTQGYDVNPNDFDYINRIDPLDLFLIENKLKDKLNSKTEFK